MSTVETIEKAYWTIKNPPFKTTILKNFFYRNKRISSQTIKKVMELDLKNTHSSTDKAWARRLPQRSTTEIMTL